MEPWLRTRTRSVERETETSTLLLGVAPSATTDEIAAAFRERAKELHPDRAPDDPATAERFKELSEAYATLTKPERRARYDEQRRQRTPAPAEPTPSRARAVPGRPPAAPGPR